MFLSIIIPCYNSFGKMSETLASLECLQEIEDVEVVLVDDGSRDDTYQSLLGWVANRQRCRVVQMPQNSGSAAGPRNLGIEVAKGEYIYFLDADDPLIPDGFLVVLRELAAIRPHVLRTPLMVRRGNGEEYLSDTLPNFTASLSQAEKVLLIVKDQSLTCSFFVRRDLLLESSIRFEEDRRIGEDICFTARVLLVAESIAYCDVPVRTYLHGTQGEASVTGAISSEQFLEFFRSWSDVEEILSVLGISFLQEHGHAALQYALRQYVWFRTERMSPDPFNRISEFCVRHWEIISKFALPTRYRELVEAAHGGDLVAFNNAARLRLLVAGHDLKFMSDLVKELGQRFEVDVDEWQGHIAHDENASRRKLNWADIVWVEWMLGAAVWYSRNIGNSQRLIIRAHRSEVTASYGDAVRFDRVAAVIAITPHLLRDFADRFDIPSSLMRFIPNFVDVGRPRQGAVPPSLFRLALVGAVPRLKGLHRALELLAKVRAVDDRFTLTIYGRRPEELDWIARDVEQREYFRDCEERATQWGLTHAVEWAGWVDSAAALPEHGVTLSMSDLEGAHVSPLQGIRAGGIALLRPWRGVEDLYPRRLILPDVEAMAERLLELRDPAVYEADRQLARSFLERLHNPEDVVNAVMDLVLSVRA